jgi:tetratricopeptide (TPR) repeat protein
MKFRQFVALCIFCAAVLPCAAAADDAGRSTPLVIGAGARAIGMGGGMSALADDASALYYNPAGLANLSYQEFTAQYSSLAASTIYNYGAWVYPISERSGLGIGYARVGTGNIIRRVNFQDLGTFDYAESELLFGYGQRIGSVSAGLTLRVLNQKIDEFSDYGIGLDAGLQYRIHRNVTASFVWRDALPTEITLKSVSERAPHTFVGGLGFKSIRISEAVKLSTTATVEKIDGRDPLFHAGGEVLLYDLCALRGGWDRNNLVLGAGARAGRVNIDYAYKLQDAIQDQHTFSLSFLIGPSVDDRIRRRDSLRNALLTIDPHTVYLNALKDTANSYMHQFRLDSALAYFNKLYAEDSTNQEYIGTIAAIENAQRVQREQEEQLRATQRELGQFVQSYYDQANAFYQKKYYGAASDVLKLIFDIQPNHEAGRALQVDISMAISADIAAYTDSAKTAEAAGNRIEIIESCDRILALDSSNAWAKETRNRALTGMDVDKHLKIGIDLFNQGQKAEAAKRFRSVLEARPGDVVALEYLKKIEAPESRVATLEDLQQDRVMWPLYLDGMRHMRDKEYNKAIEAWEKVLKAYPNQIDTKNNIEQAKLRLSTEQSGK